MKVIDFLKENVWIISAIGAFCALIGAYFSVKSWNQKKKETNQTIYNNTIKSKYDDLFEFKKSDEFSQLQLITDDNPSEIYGFCYHVVDFKEKGNSFKGILAKYRFYMLYRTAQIINNYTKDSGFSIGTIVQPDDTYYEFYKTNKDHFLILKNRFKKFYLTIFENL